MGRSSFLKPGSCTSTHDVGSSASPRMHYPSSLLLKSVHHRCATTACHHPCTTTTQLTCSSFTCPAGWVKRPQADNLRGQLSAERCCLHPTTTPCTTTTQLTCSSFTCPAGWVKRPQAHNLQGQLSAE